ncbi:hypothetical protein ACG0Z6_00035 [Roseateles sp. BYS180W]|uniref:DUF4440 domain-containing protein n=1 Tax=Roseateles rivi TaxID=3299028 RepID=A0ABW7FQU2_9BURK
MKTKIFLFATAFLAYFAHAEYVFSERHLKSWVANHAAKAMSGDPAACDNFTTDAEVVVHAEMLQGTWEVEGGKDEICGYLKQASAAYILLQAQLHTEYDDFVITRSRFPWLKAEVSYTAQSLMSRAQLPNIRSTSEETMVLSRTLTGLKISSVQAQSYTR